MDKLGIHTDGYGVISYQIGNEALGNMLSTPYGVSSSGAPSSLMRINDVSILPRGVRNNLPVELENDIKRHRLMPSILDKQTKILLGDGVGFYRNIYVDGKMTREWSELSDVRNWLDSWVGSGIAEDANDLMLSIISNFYYHGDYFVKWRFSQGKRFGYNSKPVAGLELVETRKARLATSATSNMFIDDLDYSDYNKVVVGNWQRATRDMKIYPLLKINNINSYNYAAISHHANIDTGNIYGWNRSYEGSKEWLQLSNESVGFVRSFLNNSLAARIHVIIPNEWVIGKKDSIAKVCTDNIQLQANDKELSLFSGIEVGTVYREEYLLRYINKRLADLSEYLSGANNQGKAFVSESFMNNDGHIIEWKLQPVDLKYKEYIESIISIDRRGDEVITSAIGIDPSITNISKEGVISKSGSDAYYNYMIYQNTLSSDEKICCDAYNMAMSVNFPQLYKDGYRIGLYRSTVQRQEDISPQNRMSNENSNI